MINRAGRHSSLLGLLDGNPTNFDDIIAGISTGGMTSFRLNSRVPFRSIPTKNTNAIGAFSRIDALPKLNKNSLLLFQRQRTNLGAKILADENLFLFRPAKPKIEMHKKLSHKLRPLS